MTESPSTSPEQQALLLKARQSSLLKIWVAGRRRLSEGELKELDGVLPPEILRRQPIRRAFYDHPLAHYETTFGTSLRNLKTWIAKGRAATPPELPPFDAPARMKDWWQRHMKNHVPDQIAALTRAASAEAAPPPNPPPGSPPPTLAVVPAASPPVAPAGDPAEGYIGALKRRREAEATSGRFYLMLLAEASVPGLTTDERAARQATAERARKSWDEASSVLREYERDAEKILSAHGRTWLADEVVASIEQIHGVLAAGLHQLAAKVRPALSPEQLASHAAELQRLLDGLRACRFTTPPQSLAA